MSISLRRLRIFLSSPGDVADERAIAFEVIDQLQYDPFLVNMVTLQAVAWDKPGAIAPLPATLNPQDAVNKGLPLPSACDIVVVIMWARMGTQLPHPQYQKADGSPYRSGTEWEFENALQAAEKTGRPRIIVYRRTQAPSISLTDPKRDEKIRQWEMVQNFFTGFNDPNTGAATHSYNVYQTPDEFRKRLEYGLKVFIQQLLKPPVSLTAPADTEAAAPDVTAVKPKELWKRSPFPGLRSFNPDEAPIFFGRGKETDDLLQRVANRSFVAVVGPSGSGKSSLVKAGLIPRLKHNAIEGSKDWHIVVTRLGSKNPFDALAADLLHHLPGPDIHFSEFETRRRQLAQTLHDNPDALSDTCAFALKDDERDWVKVLLFIDQFEELVTLVEPAYRAPLLDMLAHAAETEQIRIVVTLRADVYEQMHQWPQLVKLFQIGLYPLSAPDVFALHEMIVRPAVRAGLEFEDQLPERIIDDTGTDPGALPLMAYALEELYLSAQPGKTITHAVYDQLGGVQVLIGKRAETIFQDLDPIAQQALPHVLRELVDVDEQNVVIRKPADRATVTRTEGASTLVNAFIQARLIVQNDKTVELAHDALLQHWSHLQDWITEAQQFLQWRRRLRSSRTTWEHTQHDPGALLRGQQLEEAQRWIIQRGYELNDSERTYITASRTEHDRERQQKRRTKYLVRVSGLVALLALLAVLYPLVRNRVNETLLRRSAISTGDLLPVTGLTVQFERFEVTNQRYKYCVEAGVCSPPSIADFTFSSNSYYMPGKNNMPVTGVDAIQADIFCKWIGRRLPTRAEWRAAVSAGGHIWPWGDEPPIQEFAELQYKSAGGDPFAGDPAEVGTHPSGASSDEIEDLIGNVFEWTSSMPVDDTEQSASWEGWDSQEVPSKLLAVGGSYTSSPAEFPEDLDLSAPSGSRRKDLGFRCAG